MMRLEHLSAPPFLSAIAMATCLWLAGCAGGVAQEAGPPFRDPAMSMQVASDSVIFGKTTKTDVLAALGPATVVTFDSGYEVWIYREKSREPASGKAEFVLLFTPDGIVKKTRVRPANAKAG